MKRRSILHFLVCSIAFVWTRAADAQTTAPAQGFDVREWLILVCDPYQQQANAATVVNSTLPDFIDSRRTRAPAAQRRDPTPVGIIRMRGGFEGKIDVKLDIRAGKFLGTWPAAKPRSGSMLWRDLAISKDRQRMVALEPDHWLSPLREDDGAVLAMPDRSESFLLYDAELAYPLPLKVAASKTDGAVDLSNSGMTPLRDLQAYRPDGDRWRTLSIGDLAAAKPSTTPATQPAPPLFSDSPARTSAEIISDWAGHIAAWDLSAGDAKVIGRTIEALGLDSKRLTVVYRLDDSEMERLLPLEVVPQPRSIKRLGLVIVRNCDPSVLGEIDALIAQLGDTQWQKREQASDALLKFGAAARSKLQSAASNRDPEIALRAERLLANLPK